MQQKNHAATVDSPTRPHKHFRRAAHLCLQLKLKKQVLAPCGILTRLACRVVSDEVRGRVVVRVVVLFLFLSPPLGE